MLSDEIICILDFHKSRIFFFFAIKLATVRKLFDFILVLAHLVYQPKGLIQSCFVHRTSLSSCVIVDICAHPPDHRVKHRNFIFGMNMPLIYVASNLTFASNKTFISWTLIDSDNRSAVSGSWNPGTSMFIREGVVSTWH